MTRATRSPQSALLAYLCFAMASTTASFAQDSSAIDAASPVDTKLEHLTFVVDRSVMSDVMARFVEPRHAAEADRLFSAYRVDLVRLDRQAAEDVDRAGMAELLSLIRELAPARDPERMRGLAPDEQRVLVERTIANLDDPRWDTARELTQQVERSLDRANKRADARLDRLIQELCALSDPPTAVPHDVSRFIRRQLLDVDWNNGSDAFAAAVDLLELARAASAPTGELRSIRDSDSDASQPGGARPSFALDAILEAYAVELDQYLLARLTERRQKNTSSTAPLMAASGDRAFDRVDRRHGRYWYRRFLISKRASDSVEALLLELGDEEAARAWRTRYLTALCPDLVKPRWMHGMTDWLVERSDATAEQLAACRELQASFATQWSELVRQAIASGIVAMERHGSTQRHTGSAQLDAYAQRLTALHALARRTLSHFMSKLDDTQQRDLARELQQTDNGATVLDRFGPPLHHRHQQEQRRELATILKR